MRPPAFTREQDRALAELIAAGRSWNEIAEALGATRDYVRHRAVRIGAIQAKARPAPAAPQAPNERRHAGPHCLPPGHPLAMAVLRGVPA